MGLKSTPARSIQALTRIASGRLSDIGAATVADAYPRCIMTAREALGQCVHCRGLLIFRCKECDEIHRRACCACQDCACACMGSDDGVR